MSAIDDPKANRPVYFIDKTFADTALHFASPLWDLPALSNKQKAFLCMTMDMGHRWLGLPFILHLKMALKQGALCEEVKELIVQLAPYVGFPICLSAMMRIKIFSWWRRLRERHQKHPAIPKTTSIPILIPLPNDMNAQLRHHFEQALWPIWQRQTLSIEDRLLIVIAAQVATQTLGTSFQWHIQLAAANGISKQKLQEVLLFISEYGFTQSWAAMEALETYYV